MPEIGSYAAGWEKAATGVSPTPTNQIPLNPAASVFTNVVMRQLASGTPSEIPGHKTARPLRQTAVLRSQQIQGNQHVQRLVSQRLALVQRQEPEPAAAAPAVTVQLGPFTVTTYSQLLAVARVAAAELKTEAEAIPAGETVRADAEKLADDWKGWESFLSGQGESPLSEAAANQAKLWYDEYEKAKEALDKFQKRKAAEELEELESKMADAQAQIDALPAKFDDLMRAAFLNQKTDMLSQINNVFSTALDCSLAIVELQDQVKQAVNILGTTSSRASEMISKYQPLATALNKVLAGYSAIKSAISLLSGGSGPTELDKSFDKVGTLTGAVSAAGTLLGTSAAFTLYVNLYMVPVATKLIGIAQKIVREHNHLLNRLSMEEGNLDSVDWSVEPGGREMYEFMTNVMKAADSTGVPDPVPKSIGAYFVDNKDNLEAGAGVELPTKGFWFWEKVDPKKIKYWVFKNRQNLWMMFYGSHKPR
ncbi:MAG TPA: hypothetical protein PLD25_02495 [Chloroflexota bacterium]|nr:hypothetical protein [Chloroflexota bacterium]